MRIKWYLDQSGSLRSRWVQTDLWKITSGSRICSTKEQTVRVLGQSAASASGLRSSVRLSSPERTIPITRGNAMHEEYVITLAVKYERSATSAQRSLSWLGAELVEPGLMLAESLDVREWTGVIDDAT